MQLREILDEIKNYPYVTVSEQMPVADIAELIRGRPDVRSIFVLDSGGRVRGTISMGRLIRTVTGARGGGFSTRRLMRCLTCSRAGDIMTSRIITAVPDDDIEQVVDRMLAGNIKEIDQAS